ncbi:MAG: hypothetical protein ACK583_02820 [Cyanobacteriota bacterium]
MKARPATGGPGPDPSLDDCPQDDFRHSVMRSTITSRGQTVVPAAIRERF